MLSLICRQLKHDKKAESGPGWVWVRLFSGHRDTGETAGLLSISITAETNKKAKKRVRDNKK